MSTYRIPYYGLRKYYYSSNVNIFYYNTLFDHKYLLMIVIQVVVVIIVVVALVGVMIVMIVIAMTIIG